jgi:hypothetical protein
VQSAGNLGNLSLQGQANSDGTDRITVSWGDGTLHTSNQDSVLGLAQNWHDVEFNVVGDCCSTQANFNLGSDIIVRTSINDGTTNAPSCQPESFTAETNNLFETNNLLSSCSAAGGVSPAIVFRESLPAGTTVLLYDRNAGQAHVVGFDTVGSQDMDFTNSPWRKSWDMIVAGGFLGNGRQQVLLYDRNAGQADVVGFADVVGSHAAEKQDLDFTNSHFRNSWDMIVAGGFLGNGRQQVLLYDRNAGQADVVGFDASGKVNLDFTNSGWGNSLDIIVAGDFLGNGRQQVLLYDRNAGHPEVVGFNAAGQADLDVKNSNWRYSWDMIVAGDFLGNGWQQVLAYDHNAGGGDVVGFYPSGNVSLDSGWRNSWDMLVAGDFVGTGK